MTDILGYIGSKIRSFTEWFTSLFDGGKKAWEKHVPMSKEKAEQMLRRGLPRGTKVELDVDRDGSGSLKLEGSYISEVTKDFDLDKKVAYSGYMQLAKTGHGIGRKIMRNQIEFFIASGIEKLEMHAGLNAGGYTWARLGFLPSDKGEHKSAFRELKSEIRQRYKTLAPLLHANEKARIEKIIELKSPKDLWKLADSRIDLGKRLGVVFNAAAKDNKRAQALKKNISDVIEISEVEDKPQPIGRLLLAGTYWEGQLDFHNKEQMKRVSDYVGGITVTPPKPAAVHAK